MIEIDGSAGEGGGQVLRTALTLSALTGRPTRITRVRAGRRNPGLAPQHLTGVLALARVCEAEVRGAHLRSTEVLFVPRSAPRPGEYEFDVTEAASGGSAGAVTLILQALLLPLALAGAQSRLTLRGGTHVAWSPPFEYAAEVYLPLLRPTGVAATCTLEAWGFYPVGGGQISAHILPAEGLAPLRLVERGALRAVTGVALAGNLPAHIAQRIANRAQNVLGQAGLRTHITPRRVRGAGPGAGLFLTAEYELSRAGFSALGAKGKPSDQVADEACRDCLAHHARGAPLDMHLADQLLLPAALADGASELHVCRVTTHLLTNAAIIPQFVPAAIRIAGEVGQPGVVVVEGRGVPRLEGGR